MLRKIDDEREKAKQLLNSQQQQSSFNLSDFKADKTLYIDKTPNKSGNSPFNTNEISARSTIHPQKQSFGSGTLDFEDIMKSSLSQVVRDKYRESMSMGRLSTFSLPKTADMSQRTSMASSSHKGMDFWMEPSFSSVTGKNLTYSNEDFRPAEEMSMQLREDEKAQEMEYAAIPVKRVQETSTWENTTTFRPPEMSFGQYCQEKMENNDIREIYAKASPRKRSNRTALVEMTSNESRLDSMSSISDVIEKLIKKPTSQAQQVLSTYYNKNNNENHIPEILKDFNVETNQSKVRSDMIPVKDDTNEEKPMHQLQVQQEQRGLKRRTVSTSSDTPKSAMDKCLRSKSPTTEHMKLRAAERLKPALITDENVFKMPLPCDSTLKFSSQSTINGSTLREYYTAKENFSIRSPDEKLSLPNYALHRPPNATLTSPSSSVRSSKSNWSPGEVNGNKNQGQLRRSASQMSYGSEFGEDVLPIRIRNYSENKRLSFPSVRVGQSSTLSLSIQNGCEKKLPLKIHIIGPGFSVSPREDFRMIPMEARTFQITFSPSLVGPARGQLTFELANNKNCSKTFLLYAYGGHANILMDGIQKGPYGPSFITMGTVKDLRYPIERKIKLQNTGTLPAFVSVAFERTKLSDFTRVDSLIAEPMEVKVDPNSAAEINFRYKASKSEIRKIISMNKEVSTIGEICIMWGDEPTRLRLLQAKDNVHPKFMEHLPKQFSGETGIKANVLKFKEDLTPEKIQNFINQLRTHEIAFTINRDLNDTRFSIDNSLADETNMSFETFVDTNGTKINTNMEVDSELQSVEHNEIYESKYFLISPAQLTFNCTRDEPGCFKNITIKSIFDVKLLIEAVSSDPKLVTVSLINGILKKKGDLSEIRVCATQHAFEVCKVINVVIFINNAKIMIPVNFTY